MSSYTRVRPSTNSYTAQRAGVQSTSDEEDEKPKCTGHKRRSILRTAGPTSKNPGRTFYTCPRPQHDPDRCKFFKWADELKASQGVTATPIAAKVASVGAGQRLGESPTAAYGRPVTTPRSANNAASMLTPLTGRRTPPFEALDDDIDWGQVDTDTLEREAIVNSPNNSQRTIRSLTSTPVDSLTFNDRLRQAGGSVLGKRPLEEVSEITPKRAALSVPASGSNPFVSPGANSSANGSPPHHALTPSLGNLEKVSEYLFRQDRLIKAGDTAKEGFRKRIIRLEAENAQLKERIRELGG